MIVTLRCFKEICISQNLRIIIMKKWNTKMAVYGALSMATFATVFTSCSNDNQVDEIVGEDSHYKITVTLDNVNPNDDFVSVVVAGSTFNGKADVWKVNGVAKTGESAIGLNKNDFAGGTTTYVLETTEPIRAFSGGVQIINYGADLPLKYKIEKANETKVDESRTLSGDGADFTKQYSL